MFVTSTFLCDIISMDRDFYTKFGTVRAFLLVSTRFVGIRKEIKSSRERLSGTTPYYIWKARCSLVFHQVRASPTESGKKYLVGHG